MIEVFRNPQGRTEEFVSIEVRVQDTLAIVELPKLDGRARRHLSRVSQGAMVVAVFSTAFISWKTVESRKLCMADHNDVRRRKRWKAVQKYAEQMAHGQFPEHGHVYLHPSVTGEDNLVVIDGTRRMLAFLEAGYDEMPVVVVRAPPTIV
jgi:hypothetical protein